MTQPLGGPSDPDCCSISVCSQNYFGKFCQMSISFPSISFVVQSLSRVRLFVFPWTVAHQAPLSMGILQARILEWVAMPSSGGSSLPRDQPRVSRMAGRFFTV